ncbi:MAG TPA: hypothetical protein VIN58_00440 [Roseateles sp.]
MTGDPKLPGGGDRGDPGCAGDGDGAKVSRPAPRDQVHVNLLGLSPRLRAFAAHRHMTPSTAIRMAVAALLETAPQDVGEEELPDDGKHRGNDRVLVRMPPGGATRLKERARASGVSVGLYVEGLMDGTALPALPQDHAQLLATVTASTARLAAMSVDLNALMRLLGHVPANTLAPYRDSLRMLDADVRAHLVAASGLLAELQACRRPR